jgi:putative transcriptional regulator
VQPQVGFVVHSDDVGLESSLAVTGHVAVTSDPKILRALASGRAPRRWLFVLGYAGWAPGQLEAELARHDWFVVPYDEELLFGADHGAKWQRALELRGIEL